MLQNKILKFNGNLKILCQSQVLEPYLSNALAGGDISNSLWNQAWALISPTSQLSALRPSQPSPFLWFPVQPVVSSSAAWWSGVGRKEKEGGGLRGGVGEGKGKVRGEGGWCWAPSREAEPGPFQ